MSERPVREPLLFAVGCVAVALAFQGSRGLFDTDEGRYAECAREMLVSGDLLVPRLQGQPHITKPPGTYWLIAAGLELLGRNAWGARLFLGLAFAGSAAAVRVLGGAILGAAGGARAGWCYLGMLFPFVAGSILTTDTFLAAGVLGSLACVALALRGTSPVPSLAGAAVCLAAALLTKAHVGLLPWSAGLVGLALLPGRASAARWTGVGVAAVAAIGLALPWYLWADANIPGASAHFRDEVARRLTGTGDHRARPLWFYPAILAAGSTPWWVLVVRGMRRATPAAPPAEGGSPPSARPWFARLGISGPGAAILVWAGVPFLVFLAAPAKLELYVLPVAAPIAVWAAAGARDPDSPWPVRPRALAAWLVVLVALRGAAAWVSTLPVSPRNDMLALARLVETADAGRGLPVVLLAGADAQGLEFYRDGRLVRVSSVEVRSDRAPRAFGDEVRDRAAAGETWLLVTEQDEDCEASVRRVLRGAPREIASRKGWRVLEIAGGGRR